MFLHYDANEELDCIVGIYVDDLVIAASTELRANRVRQIFQKRYKMEDLGEMKWFLGIQIQRDDENEEIWMSQEAYIMTTLERFGMLDCKPVGTPMVASDVLTKDDCPEEGSEEQEEMKKKPYREVIGCLLYIARCTRPDIAVAVNKLAKFVSNPGVKHWKAAKRTLRYLRGTKQYGIKFTTEGELTLSGFADASWGDEDEERRSTTGYLFKVGDNIVQWRTMVQKTTARSTTEAEYMAISDAVLDGIWLRRLCDELGIPQDYPTIMYEDNDSCKSVAEGDGVTRRTKHIDVRYHHVEKVPSLELGQLLFFFVCNGD